MADAASFKFKHLELIEMMVRHQGLRDGLWTLEISFGLGAGNVGTDADIKPTAFVAVANIGILRVDAPGPLVIDASKLIY